jgi:hypothetical protein
MFGGLVHNKKKKKKRIFFNGIGKDDISSE